MSDVAALVANNLNIWTSAIQRKSGAGRGGGKRISLYGIERLRALILDLAVCGKLVPQDAEDESASKHLLTAPQRVDAASAKGRRKQILPRPDENPKLPSGWAPTHLGSIVDIVRGITFPGSEKSKTPECGRVACLRTSNVQNQIEWDDILYIRDKFVSREDQYVRQNDIIISMANSRELVGKVAMIERDPQTPTAFGGFLAAIRAHSVDPRFLMTFLRCPATKAQLIDDASQTTNIANISLSKLNPLPVPLPPIAEQGRIVAKVDELMALCDALERESANAMAAHQTLVEELLATLVNSASAADLAANWARLEAHFDVLFTTDASIDALKQTILGLAVRGKLVEQDARDEAAIGRLQGQQAEAPFDIPANWQCVPLKALGRQIGGGTPSKSRSDFWGGPIPWVSPKDMKIDYLSDAELSVTESALEGSAVKLIPAESLMFVVRGMILAHSFPVAVAKASVTINQDMKAIELYQPAMVEYLLRALKGLKPLMLDRVERSSHGTCRLDSVAYGSFPIPIPPLAEQNRIVAKVDELVTLCDDLKARITDAGQTRCHLAEAITERAAA